MATDKPNDKTDKDAWRAEALAVIKPRFEHMEANPPRDERGIALYSVDQAAVTIEHTVMAQVMEREPFKSGKAWEHPRVLFREAPRNTISREYPGLWVRAMIDALAVKSDVKEG